MYYSRKPTRIPNYDYSKRNYYFITICTDHRRCIFGQPDQLNFSGKIAAKHISQIPFYYEHVWIDKFVVMPNHVHMILVMDGEENPDASLVIGQYKRGVTMEIRETLPDMSVWQRSFHDHIIRNQAEYEKIWLYIDANPLNWNKDCFYVERTVGFAQNGLG